MYEKLRNATSRTAEGEKQLKEWKVVTKQELIDFIKEYPFPVVQDFYMEWNTWNDFRDGRVWPESMIAMASIYDDEFKIYDGYIQEKPQTNADRIRAMTDEELAEFLGDNDSNFPIGDHKKEWLAWLKQEVKE